MSSSTAATVPPASKRAPAPTANPTAASRFRVQGFFCRRLGGLTGRPHSFHRSVSSALGTCTSPNPLPAASRSWVEART